MPDTNGTSRHSPSASRYRQFREGGQPNRLRRYFLRFRSRSRNRWSSSGTARVHLRFARSPIEAPATCGSCPHPEGSGAFRIAAEKGEWGYAKLTGGQRCRLGKRVIDKGFTWVKTPVRVRPKRGRNPIETRRSGPRLGHLAGKNLRVHGFRNFQNYRLRVIAQCG